MFFLIYIAAVLVSLVLHRQERRHLYELSLEHQRLGKAMPAPKPKLPKLESWLNLVLGAFLLFGFGATFLWINLSRLSESVRDPRFTPYAAEWEFTSVVLATGIALVILGIRSLIQNRRYTRTVHSHKS